MQESETHSASASATADRREKQRLVLYVEPNAQPQADKGLIEESKPESPDRLIY